MKYRLYMEKGGAVLTLLNAKISDSNKKIKLFRFGKIFKSIIEEYQEAVKDLKAKYSIIAEFETDKDLSKIKEYNNAIADLKTDTDKLLDSEVEGIDIKFPVFKDSFYAGIDIVTSEHMIALDKFGMIEEETE